MPPPRQIYPAFANPIYDSAFKHVMENVEIGRHSEVRRAIIDKNVVIPPHTKIGVDPAEDKKRFHVTESGIVVIPKGTHVH